MGKEREKILLQKLELDSVGESLTLLERIKRLSGITVILAISEGLRATGGAMAKTMLEAISKSDNYARARFYWFNVDQGAELYAGLSMGGVPSLIILKDGKEVTFTKARFSGAISRDTVLSALDIIMDPARSLPAEPENVQLVASQP